MVMMLGEAKGVITLDVTDLSAKTAQATSTLGKLESAAGSGFSKLDSQLQAVGMTTDQLGKGMIGFGLALGAPIALGVVAAANLEQAFVNVHTALGDVTDNDFQALQDEIIDIGANGQYSAQQIAMVSEELAKAGRGVEEQLGGNMLKAVSDLASATGTDLMTSVNGINSVMAVWSEETVGATLAMTDAAEVADIFTFAANNSQASVEDIMMGMRNLGPIAATMGVGFDEAAATIAVFTNNGIKASVAGTALNTAITRLANPTSEASILMEQLGIDAFDAQGKFIGFPAMFDNLAVSMQGLTMEQKAAHLATIFGLEAMDAMALAAMNGGDAIRELTIGQKDYGIAAKQAEARTKTLLGAWQRLTEGVTVFLALLAGGLVGPLTVLANGLDKLIAVISMIPAPILAAVGTVMALVAAFSIAGGAAILAAPKVMNFIRTVRLLAATQGPLTGVAQGLLSAAKAARVLAIALTGVGLVAGAVFLAYKTNFLGFADWVNGTFGEVIDFFKGTTQDLQDAATSATKTFNGTVETVHNADGTTAWFYTEMDDNGTQQRLGQIIDSKEDLDGDNKVEVLIQTDDGEYWTWIDLNTGEIVGESTIEVKAEEEPSSWEKFENRLDKLKRAWEAKGWDIPAAAIGGVQKIMDGLQSAWKYAGNLMKRIRLFHKLFTTFRKSGMGFVDSLKKAFNWNDMFGGEMGFIESIPGRFRNALSAIPGIVNSVFQAGVAVKDWTLDVAVPKVTGWLKTAGATAWDAISSAAGWVSGKAADLKDWTLDVTLPTVTGWLSTVGDTLWGALSSAAGFAGDLLAQLGTWTLETAIPTVTGWISGLASDAWGAIKDAIGWEGSFTATLEGWGLEIPSPTEVLGWISDFVADPLGQLKSLIPDLDSFEISLAGWTLQVDEPNVRAWMKNFDLWFVDHLGFSPGATIIEMRDWTLDVGAPRVIEVVSDIAILIADAIGGVAVGLADVIMRVSFSEELTILGYDADEIIENSLGYLAEQGIDVLIKILWSFTEDPLTSLQRTLALTFLAGLVLSVAVTGFTATILPLALIVLAFAIYNQLRDYFARNPAKIDELKVEIGKMWTELESGKFGWMFVVLRKIGEAAKFAAEGLMAFDEWASGLPTPLSDAYVWVKRLTIALIALQAVSLAGGFTPGKTGKGSKGFIGGLLNGLWMLLAFPFKLAFNPLKTLRNLFGKRPGGAGGGARGWLPRSISYLWALVKAPFRAISNGFKAIGSGWSAFHKAFTKGIKNTPKGFKDFVSAFGRGFKALWGHMKGGKNIMGRFLKGLGAFGTALRKVLITPLIKMGGLLGAGLQKMFTSKTLFPKMLSWFKFGFTSAMRGIVAFARGSVGALMAGLRALFTSKFGIIANPKAFAAFDKLSGIFAKIRAPLAKLLPFFIKLRPAMRLLLSPVALLARGAVALVPALAAIPGIGWIILGVIALLAAGFLAWKTNFLGFRDAVKSGWSSIVNAFENIKRIWDTLKDAFERGGWSEVWDTLVNMFESIDWSSLGMTLLRGAAVAIGMLLFGIPGLLVGLTLAFLSAFLNIDWGSIGSSIWNGLMSALSWLAGIGSAIWGWLTEAVSGIEWGKLWDGVKDVTSAIVDKFGDLLGAITGWIGENVPGVGDWMQIASGAFGIAARIVKGFGNLLGEVASWIAGAVPGVSTWMQIASGAFGIAAKIVKGFGNLLGEVVSWISGAVPGVGTWMNIASGAFGIAKRIVKGFGNLLGEVVSWIKGATPGADMWLSIAKGAKDIAGDIVEGFGDLAGEVSTWANAAIDEAIRVFSTFAGAVRTAIGNLDFGWIEDGISGIGDAASAAYGFLEDFASGLGKVAGAIGDLVSSGWDRLPNWLTGQDDNAMNAAQMETLAGAIEEAETRITDSLDAINTAFLEFDDTVSVDAIDAKLSTAFIAQDATVLGTSISNWVKRGLSKMQALVATEQVGLRAARSIDSDFKTGFAGLDGTSLGGSLKSWIGRGVSKALVTLTELRVGLSVARSLDAQMNAGFAGLSGASLGGALTAWISRGVTSSLSTLAGANFGLSIARVVNALIVAGFAGLSGDSLGSAIRSWIERGTNVAMQSMTKFRDEVVRVLQDMTSKASSEMGKFARTMTDKAKEAQRGLSEAMKSAQQSTSRAMSDIQSTVSRGMSAVAREGRNGGRAFADGFRDSAQRAVSAMRGVVSDIRGAASGLAGSMRGLGANAGAALAQGLLSQIGAVRAAAGALVAAANVSASKKAQLGSPSRVWIYFGQMMAMGLANGIAKYGQLAVSAAEAVVHEMNDAMHIDPLSAQGPSWLTSQQSMAPHLLASGSGGGNTVYNNEITVVQREGEDTVGFAYRVASIISGADIDASGE